MIKIFKIFFRIYSARLAKDFNLPLFNQIMQTLGAICFFILHLVAFRLIISKFSFTGWTDGQLLVLLLTFELFTYSAFFLFYRGLNYTVTEINNGSFDFFLSKPFPSRLLTIFRGGGSHNFILIILSQVLLYWVFINYHLNFYLPLLIPYYFTLLTSLFTAYNLSCIFLTPNFKYGKITASQSAIFYIQEIYKYPSTLFYGPNLLVFILPLVLSLLTSYPAMLLLNKPIPISLSIVYFGTLFVSWLLANYTWRTSLRHYSSAS